MKSTKKHVKKIVVIGLCMVVVIVGIFLIGRYGWKLGGFSVCESARIESVEVLEGKVHISGGDPYVFSRGFLGYHAEEKDGTLYVGFKFSEVFGIFEKGNFDILIPVEGEIEEVVIKTKNNEYSIWPQESE